MSFPAVSRFLRRSPGHDNVGDREIRVWIGVQYDAAVLCLIGQNPAAARRYAGGQAANRELYFPRKAVLSLGANEQRRTAAGTELRLVRVEIEFEVRLAGRDLEEVRIVRAAIQI